MIKCVFVFVTALLLVCPSASHAWGVLGHRVIGGIAEQYLTAKTKVEIRKLLGNESVAMASNWADFIKSDRRYDSLGPWHYVNLPPGMPENTVYERLRSEKGVNLYNRLEFLKNELKSGSLPRERKLLYLKLLIHFVADAHQPMHAGEPDDRGGNSIKLYWFNEPTNLHRLWDEHLIEFQQLSYTEYVSAINFPAAGQKEKWQRQPVREWIYESYVAAQQLYKEVKPEDRLSYQYNYHHVSLMNEQLLKGGIRLAAALNEIFGK